MRRYAKETFVMTAEVTAAIADLVTALRAADASTRGIAIDETFGLTAVVSVPVTETITSGVMRCYAYLPVDLNADGSIAARRWVKYPNLDIDLIGDTGVTTATERDIPIGDQLSLSKAGRICWLPDAVTGSTGSALLTVTYTLSRRNI
jgi:hypothetical protein